MRAFFRRKLDSILEIAKDEDFVQLIWAANALQSGSPKAAVPFLQPGTFSAEAITEDMTNRSFIYKWELETLVNELMTVPKRTTPKRGKERQLNCENYNNAVNAANYLRKLENAESKRRVNDDHILVEMARIANRQFDWQRGYLNLPQFYRNAFVYGQGKCAAYFEAQHGITINQLSLVGMVLYVSLIRQPVFNRFTDLSQFGIGRDEFFRALSLVSQPFENAQTDARRSRSGIYHTAYRPSMLRQKPCLIFGTDDERVRAPLPQLILERVTSGIFYNVVGGGGSVRADYGKRFEDYCLSYLRATLPALEWLEETNYRVKPNRIDTPDILCRHDGHLSIAIECKASRMSHGARFGEDPLDHRGFNDLIKGVYQLWRFFSHCRRNLSGFTLGDETIGMVLTLDGWLIMAETLRTRVIDAAVAMAAEKDPEILEEDRLPIAFVSITDLESTLVRATERTFCEAVLATAGPEYNGWMLNNVHNHFVDPNPPERDYPFKADFGRLLPWWDMFMDEHAARRPTLAR